MERETVNCTNIWASTRARSYSRPKNTQERNESLPLATRNKKTQNKNLKPTLKSKDKMPSPSSQASRLRNSKQLATKRKKALRLTTWFLEISTGIKASNVW